MECSEDLACQIFDWFSGNGYFLRQSFETFDALWKAAGGRITHFFAEHGEKLVALASLSFAVYRWWIYRERILYKRLEEYIRESDKRLGPTTSQMMETILRPGRTVALRQPAYAVEISEVLDRSGWRRFFGLAAVEKQAQRQLHKALVGILKREQTVQDAAQSLQRQKAEVYKLRGAIASAFARRSSDRTLATELDDEALDEFRRALECTTHRRDPKAKECEALQYLRLGDRELALESYVELADFASGLPERSGRDLTRARAKRFQAQILQADAEPAGSVNAWTALALENENAEYRELSALELRRMHGPYTKWDAIEQAEMHYLAAYIANRNRYGVQEPRHLGLAESVYRGVTRQLPKRHIFVGRATRRLRAEAKAGTDRLILAKAGRYDLKWLLV